MDPTQGGTFHEEIARAHFMLKGKGQYEIAVDEKNKFNIVSAAGPVVLRFRTENRADKTHLPSLTPLWRGAEFQEREVYDLYGVIFDGHPDLRRILMWDEFVGFPMRRDYVAPDDFEYEPTPHDEVLVEAKKHYPAEPKAEVKA